MKEKVIEIMNEVERFLERRNIFIPDENRTGEPDEAHLFGNAYYELEDKIETCLKEPALTLSQAFKLCNIEEFDRIELEFPEKDHCLVGSIVQEIRDPDHMIVTRIGRNMDEIFEKEVWNFQVRMEVY